jgi:hypothetical protein
VGCAYRQCELACFFPAHTTRRCVLTGDSAGPAISRDRLPITAQCFIVFALRLWHTAKHQSAVGLKQYFNCPTWEQSETAVLHSLAAAKSQEPYSTSRPDFRNLVTLIVTARVATISILCSIPICSQFGRLCPELHSPVDFGALFFAAPPPLRLALQCRWTPFSLSSLLFTAVSAGTLLPQRDASRAPCRSLPKPHIISSLFSLLLQGHGPAPRFWNPYPANSG